MRGTLTIGASIRERLPATSAELAASLNLKRHKVDRMLHYLKTQGLVMKTEKRSGNSFLWELT